MGCQDEITDARPKTKGLEDQEGKMRFETISDDIFSRGATQEQLDALRAAVDAHKAAQAKVMEAVGILWNSQVDSAIATGGEYFGTSIAMSRRLNFFDNCTCSPCKIVV